MTLANTDPWIPQGGTVTYKGTWETDAFTTPADLVSTVQKALAADALTLSDNQLSNLPGLASIVENLNNQQFNISLTIAVTVTYDIASIQGLIDGAVTGANQKVLSSSIPSATDQNGNPIQTYQPTPTGNANPPAPTASWWSKIEAFFLGLTAGSGLTLAIVAVALIAGIILVGSTPKASK